MSRPRYAQMRSTQRLTGGTDTDERWAAKKCADDPWRWDAEIDGEFSRSTRKARLDDARDTCLTCPALALCAQWLAVNPDATGVVAGRVMGR